MFGVLKKEWKPPTLELPEALKSLGPKLKELGRQEDQERLNALSDLNQRIADETAQRDEQVPLKAIAAAEARAEREALESKYHQAIIRERDAEMGRLGLSLEFQLKIDSLRGQVRALAPKMIDAFILDLVKLSEDSRVQATVSERLSEPNWIGTRKVIISGNIASISQRSDSIRSAIAAAEELKFAAVPVDALIERLNSLLRSIPDVVMADQVFDRVQGPERQLRSA